MRIFLMAAVMGLGLAGPALAGSIEDAVKQALALSAAGKGAESAAMMRDATAELRLQTPLEFAEAMFISEKAPRFGAYAPRESIIYATGETLLVYAEPIGFGWRKDGEIYVTDLVVDAALLSPEGDLLWEQKEFGRFDLSSRYRFVEYFMNLSLDITGLPEGNFVLQYTVTDMVRDGQAKISLPFVHQ